MDSHKTSFSALTKSLMPKPWHVIKKRDIIQDGLVQTRLNQFRKLTNEGRGESSVIISDLGSTNGRTGKRKAGTIDSPSAVRQRNI